MRCIRMTSRPPELSPFTKFAVATGCSAIILTVIAVCYAYMTVR